MKLEDILAVFKENGLDDNAIKENLLALKDEIVAFLGEEPEKEPDDYEEVKSELFGL